MAFDQAVVTGHLRCCCFVYFVTFIDLCGLGGLLSDCVPLCFLRMFAYLLSVTKTTVITRYNWITHYFNCIRQIFLAFKRYIMPAARQPLRERCNVKLNVATAISVQESFNTPVYDDDVFTKRRRHVPDVRVPFTNAVAEKKNAIMPRLHPVNPSAARGLQSLHELLPYLFISFHTGNRLPAQVITKDGTTFTHIVKITHATPKRKAGTMDIGEDAKRGLYTLTLVVPTSPLRGRGRRRVRSRGKVCATILTDYQLLAARDFLSLALPYYSEARPKNPIPGPVGSADQVRVLVTAPAGDTAATDVMTIAACYITFVSRVCAQTVLECIEKEEEVPWYWKGIIGEGKDGFSLIDYVAEMGE
jgi:hypothetical protein